MKRSKKGFTLIELVVVMALIALLSLLVIGAIIAARRMVTETKHRNNGKSIQVGMEKFYASNKSYPVATNVRNGYTATAANNKFSDMATFLAVSIESTATEAAACQTTGAAGGGGKVALTSATAFSIKPWDWNCGVALDDECVALN